MTAEVERKVDRILLGQERLSEKIDSVKVSVDRVTEEVYVGRDGHKSIKVQLSEFASRIYHLEGKRRTSPPPAAPPRAEMASVTEVAVPAPANGGRRIAGLVSLGTGVLALATGTVYGLIRIIEKLLAQ